MPKKNDLQDLKYNPRNGSFLAELVLLQFAGGDDDDNDDDGDYEAR